MIIPTFNLNKISLSKLAGEYFVKDILGSKMYLVLANNWIYHALIYNESTMSKYVRIDKINDPRLLPRVLTAESIITDHFCLYK